MIADLHVAIDPVGFREAFTGDIDDETAAVLAIVQRPANVKAVSEAVVNEAFRSVPSWVLITRQDRAISHDLQQFMAGRTDAHITELDALAPSHDQSPRRRRRRHHASRELRAIAMPDFDIIVIGAGQAGEVLVGRSATGGLSTALVRSAGSRP